MITSPAPIAPIIAPQKLSHTVTMAHKLPQPLPLVPQLDQIVPIAEEGISKIRCVRQRILQTITPDTATFSSVIQPRAELWNVIQAEQGMLWVLGYASPDNEVHNEIDKVRELMRRVNSEWMSEIPFFQLLKAATEKNELLDTEDQLWLKEDLLNHTRCGHGILSQEQIGHYLELQNEINMMRSKYAKNLRTEDSGIWFNVEELDGVPSIHLESWKANEEFPGKKFVPFANGGTKTVLTYANNSKTRKRMYLADEKKVPENVQLFRDVIIRRDTQARKLGYTSHSAFRVERRAAKSVDWVQTFLHKLREDLALHGTEELNLLKSRRRKHLQNKGITLENDEKFQPWDLKFYQRLAEEELDIDRYKISEFFPLEYTAPAMLELFAELLNLHFSPIPQDELDSTLIWHENVQVWSVWEKSKESNFVGYLYFDLIWRENKYQGCQNVTIENVCVSLIV